MWQKIKNYYHLFQAFCAATLNGFPAKKLKIIGITGTDGKSTTVNMIYHVLKYAHQKVSMISSVGAQIGNITYDTGFHVSTPSPWRLQKHLRQALSSGSRYFVLEATSHGLDQNRLAFVNFEVGVITNITHEHLDYHKTRRNYVQAKLKLLKKSKLAVINADDDSFNLLKSHINGKIVTYSKYKKTDFNLKNLSIKLKIPGEYNLSNALAAASACRQLGIEKRKIIAALANFPGIKGRIEEINMGQDFKVFIDFAHTPNGLKEALKTLQLMKKGEGKLIAVFGSAGERDSSKRPKMGQIASSMADEIILTAEDPRREDPQDIVHQIASGIKNIKSEKINIIIDRAKAIDFAVSIAKKGDIIGIFGKGHEKSMAFGKNETPWDEFKIVEDAIKRRLNG